MSKRIFAIAAAAVSCIAGGAELDDFIHGDANLYFRSKWLSYGLVDGNDPILQPNVNLSFFDTLTLGVTTYLDITDFGKHRGRGDRTWDFWEFDYTGDARHVFTPDDVQWLPTSVEIGVGYRYEYYPPCTHYSDAQFWLADMALPDLWLVPRFVYERETMLDHGTYLNFSLEHEFELTETVSFVPVVSQGFGDKKRLRGYLIREDGRPFDRAGLMDFQITLGLVWSALDWLDVSGYVAYTDFPFDSHVREAARRYRTEMSNPTSWNFTAGIGLKAYF